VVNVAASRAGYWSNLSTTAVRGAAPANLAGFNDRFVGEGAVLETGAGLSSLMPTENDRFSETQRAGGMAATYEGGYGYVGLGPDAGRLTLDYDDGTRCRVNIYFSSRTSGWFASSCSGGVDPEDTRSGGDWFVGDDEVSDPVGTTYGVDEALPANPARAGEGTVLLSGMEVRLRDRHTNILGDRARYVFALDGTWHYLDPDSIAAAHHRGARPPTMLYTIPGPLDRIVPLGLGSPAGVIGVELSDGAPRGLEQGRAEREDILALADSMDLAVLAGTNNHGWGRTVPAWSVMRLPGWPHMSPDELGSAIEDVLHRERRRAVTVVERTMPYHGGSAIKLAATVPLLLWSHFRTLTLWERASWLAWVAIWAAVRAHRARHRATTR